MMCNICEISMTTEKDSEKGMMTGVYYMTQEIKVCPLCGKRVLEKYEATEFKKIKVEMKKIKTQN